MTSAHSLSIVVPCFNEEQNVEGVVRQAVAIGRQVAHRLEVIVVDDGSTDDSRFVLERLGETFPEVRSIQHSHNQGYGAALRTAFMAARHQHVFLTDGDGQFDLGDLPSALELLDTHDMVAGYRIGRKDGVPRRVCGWLWTRLTNWALGARVRDMNCAFKVLPRGLVADGDFVSTGALISAELVSEAERRGLSIGQVGVRHLPRAKGRATGGSAVVVMRALSELARLLTRRRGFARGASPRRAFRRQL